MTIDELIADLREKARTADFTFYTKAALDAIDPLIAEIERQATEIARAKAALKGMMAHSCVADADPRDKCAEDHDAEAAALRVIRSAP